MNAPVELILEQGSQEWHDKRRTLRPASNAGTVMKCSPYATWEDLANFYNGIDKEVSEFQKSIFQHGHDLEPVLRSAFGGGFEPTVFEIGEYMASLDGWNGKAVLEIKAPATGKKSKTWKAACDGKIEPHYEWQLHHQLYVTGADTAFFLVGISADEYQVIKVERDEKKIEQLLAGWEAFFDFLLTYQPVQERTDKDWKSAAEHYRVCKTLLDETQAQLEEAKQALLDLASGTKTYGAGVSVTKFSRKGAVDYAKIPELKGVDLEQYRKESTETVSITIDKE